MFKILTVFSFFVVFLDAQVSNYLYLRPLSADTGHFIFLLDSCDRLLALPDTSNVESVFVFVETDSGELANNFSTSLVAKATLNKAGIRMNGCPSDQIIGGLTSARRYYAGIAVKNGSGIWSDRINIRSFWTRPANVAKVSAFVTPAKGDSGIVCRLYNITKLNPAIDTIKIFYSLGGYQTNPQWPPDTALRRSIITGDSIDIMVAGLSGSKKYFVSTTVGVSAISDNSVRWGAIDTLSSAGNCDTVRTGDYSAPAIPVSQLIAIYDTAVHFSVQSSFVFSSNTDSVLFYVWADSQQMQTHFRSMAPTAKRDTANSKTAIVVDTLRSGAVYWIGVASKSREGIWSNGVSIKRIQTGVNNPLTINWKRLTTSSIVVKIGGVLRLPQSAETVKLWNRSRLSGGYQNDSSVAADFSYSVSYPFGSDTIADTIVFSPGSVDTFCLSVTAGYPTNWAGISDLNRNAVYIDNVAPVNMLVIGATDSTHNSITFSIGNATVPSDVDSFYIFRSSDSVGLYSAFAARNSLYAIPKTSLIGNTVAGLSEMTRYWIGVALKDGMGNWSTSLSVVARYTKPINPLSLSVAERGVGGSLSVTIHGCKSLNGALIDTVRLFYRTDAPLFNPASYSAEQLKGSYSLAALTNDSVVIVNNMESTTKYYFAVNERAVVNGSVLFGDIASANKIEYTTNNYQEPQNIGISITGTAPDSIYVRLIDAPLLAANVEKVFLFVGTSSAYLRSAYKTISAFDTLSRSEAVMSATIGINGLQQGTRYFVGVAVRDSSGNWSNELSIDSARTMIVNTLRPELFTTPKDNRRVRLKVSELSALSAEVDSVRIFFGTTQVLNPLEAMARDTVVAKAALFDTVFLMLEDTRTFLCYVSVAPFAFDEGTRWFSDIPLSASSSIWYDSDEPANPLNLRIDDTTLTTLKVEVTNWATLFSTDVDSIHFWIRKMASSADSVILATQHKSLMASAKISINELIGGAGVSFTALDTGANYYVGVAPCDSNGNISNFAAVYRFRTASPPPNPVSVSAQPLYYSTARVTFSNLNMLLGDIDRAKVKLILSDVAYVLNGYDTVNIRYYDVGSDSITRTFLVTGLKAATKYYLSVALSNKRGYWSRVSQLMNVCTLQTLVAADTVHPDGAKISFTADTSQYAPERQISVTVSGIDSIAAGDRYSGGMRIYWSELSPYTNFQIPSQSVGYIDWNLINVIGDTFSTEIYPLLSGSIGSGVGRKYHLTFAIRDSAFNWDTTSIKSAVAWTRVDLVRPKNDTGWSVSTTGYTGLSVGWNRAVFNKVPITSFRDTIPSLGVWLSTSPISQAYVDTALPNFSIDSSALPPQYFYALKHNTNYFIACAPINKSGNRGAVEDGKSLFQIKTPFDSSTIAHTPPLCTLTVLHASMPESLTVLYSLYANRFTDPVNLIDLSVKSIIIRYRTDGVYPSNESDGSLARQIAIDSVLSGSFKLWPVPLGADLRFTTFVVSSLSPSYVNRYSLPAAHARAAIRTWSYPVNTLAITRLVPQGGLGQPVRIAIDWRVASGPIPPGVRFLYKQFAGYDDVPNSINSAGFAYFDPPTLAYSRRDTIPVVLKERTKYTVAAFVRNESGVWSKSCVWDTITTPKGIDTIGPARLPIEVSARALDCRTVRVRWRIDPALFYSAQYAENNKLSFLLDWSENPEYFLSPLTNKPYRDSGRINVMRPLDSIVIRDLEPNKDYYFAMTTADSVGNQAKTDSLSVAFCRLFVPTVPDSMVKVSLVDNELFTLSWRDAINIDGNLWKADTHVRFVTFVMQSDSFYNGPMPATEATLGKKIVRSVEAVGAAYSERALRFDENDYYLTFWPSVERFVYGGDPLKKGPFRYKIDKPRFDSAVVKQLSDTVLMVSVKVNDSTENRLQLRTSYSLDGGKTNSELPASALRIGDSLRLTIDTINSGAVYTSYINISKLPAKEWNAIRGTDTVKLSISLSLSDMRPVSSLLPDTTATLVANIDNRPPYNASISIGINRSSKRLSVVATSDSLGEFSTMGIKCKGASVFNFYHYSGTPLVFDTIGVDGVVVRLIDSIGNYCDTAWNDFSFVRLPFKDSLYNTGERYYDNGSVAVSVPVTALNPVPLNNGFLTVGLASVPVDSAKLRGLGFVRSRPETYFFISELRATSIGVLPFYNTGLNLKFTMPLADTAVRLYKVTDGSRLEELGTIVEEGGKVLRLANFKTDSFWNSVTSQEPANSDTFYIVALRDLRAPIIDTALTGLFVNAKGDSGVVKIRVRDNNVNLDAGIRIHTYRLDKGCADTVLWDTVTTKFVSGTRNSKITTPDTLIECTYDISQILKANAARIRTAGLHFSIWVSDGRKRFSFHSAPISVDSVVGVFPSLRPNWSLVSITAMPNSYTTIVDAITSTQGNYNRERMRVMRLDGNSFREYSSSDPGFRVMPGRAFLVVTRSDADITMNYKIGQSKLPTQKGSKGFIVASGGTTGGWRLASLPFIGSVKQSSIIASSKIDTSNGRVPLLQRMWTMYGGSFRLLNQYQALSDSARISASKGFGDGLLLYLYPNEEIVAPTVDNVNFLHKQGSLMTQNGQQSEWSLQFTVAAINSSGRIIACDAMNVVGVYNMSISSYVPDIKFPDAPEAGIVEGNELAAVSYKTKSDSGYIWDIQVKSDREDVKGLSMAFTNMSLLPDKLMAVLDLPDVSYSVNLRENDQLFSDLFGKAKDRCYRLLVGDSLFVARNSSGGFLPSLFSLHGNYPNPFNPATSIAYSIPLDPLKNGYAGSLLQIVVYDTRGRIIRVIAHGQPRAGRHVVMWDGRNEIGNTVASGVYLYRLTITGSSGSIIYRTVKKMTLLK